MAYSILGPEPRPGSLYRVTPCPQHIHTHPPATLTVHPTLALTRTLKRQRQIQRQIQSNKLNRNQRGSPDQGVTLLCTLQGRWASGYIGGDQVGTLFFLFFVCWINRGDQESLPPLLLALSPMLLALSSMLMT